MRLWSPFGLEAPPGRRWCRSCGTPYLARGQRRLGPFAAEAPPRPQGGVETAASAAGGPQTRSERRGERTCCTPPRTTHPLARLVFIFPSALHSTTIGLSNGPSICNRHPSARTTVNSYIVLNSIDSTPVM
ncbi:unnamed protein product, partial [Iphiclides podalirius]